MGKRTNSKLCPIIVKRFLKAAEGKFDEKIVCASGNYQYQSCIAASVCSILPISLINWDI